MIHRRLFPVLAVLAAMAVAAVAVPASARVAVETLGETEYVVRGTTPREVYDSMHAYGARLGGEVALALCETTMTFTYKVVGRGGQYRLADHRVLLQYRYHYPRWVSRDYAPLPLREAWDAILAVMTRHEKMHAAIYLRHAAKLDQELGRLRPSGNAAQVRRAAESLFDKRTRLVNAENAQWDRECGDAERINDLLRAADARIRAGRVR